MRRMSLSSDFPLRHSSSEQMMCPISVELKTRVGELESQTPTSSRANLILVELKLGSWQGGYSHASPESTTPPPASLPRGKRALPLTALGARELTLHLTTSQLRALSCAAPASCHSSARARRASGPSSPRAAVLPRRILRNPILFCP